MVQEILRIIRRLHARVASHMALGFLFLGGCRSAAPSQYFLYTPDNIIPWCIGVLFAMNVFFLAIQSRLFSSSSPDYAHSLLHLFLPLTFLTPNSLSSLSSLSFITLLVSLLPLFLFFSLLRLLSQSQQQAIACLYSAVFPLLNRSLNHRRSLPSPGPPTSLRPRRRAEGTSHARCRS